MPRSLFLFGSVLLLAGCFSQPVQDLRPEKTGRRADPASPSAKGGGSARAPAAGAASRSSEPPERALLVPREDVGDVAVARVKDEEIRRSDIGEFLIRFFRDEANRALNHLIDERILAVEAESSGVTVPPEAVEEAVREEMTARENRVKVQFGADTTLEEYLRDRYGSTVEEHRGNVLRLVRVRLLLERQVRYHQMREDRVDARDAVFATREAALRAARSAREGADLASLAKEGGLRPEVVLPPFPRDSLEPGVSDAVFALAPGQVSDPIEVEEGGRKVYHVFKVVERTPARNVAWEDVRDEVEAGLASRPFEQYEHLQWARQMRAKHRVEILR